MSGSEEWDRRQQEEDKATDKLAEDLSRWINRAGDSDIERLANAILRDHRTLQQKTFGFILSVIGKWANLDDNHYDMRNQYTVEKSKAIVELLGTYGLKPPCI